MKEICGKCEGIMNIVCGLSPPPPVPAARHKKFKKYEGNKKKYGKYVENMKK